MTVLAGESGAVRLGATSATAILYINSWVLSNSMDEYIQKPLSQAYATRVMGHEDWTCQIEADLDNADTELAKLMVVGAAIILYLYSDETTPYGQTATGVVTAVNKTVSGVAVNAVSITVGGNGALSAIS